MHIPDHMLNGAICPVTAGISAVAVAASVYFAFKSDEKPASLKFAAVASLIFALQMMNFPILNGTSGHFLGTTLAISLLGIPFGILSMIMVIAVQCLVFSDGGISILGANILNMALVGSIPGIIINYIFKNRKLINSNLKKGILIFSASWLSIVLASLSCSIELWISGTVSFIKIFPAMVGVHSLIGIFEGVITVVLFSILYVSQIKESRKLSAGIPIISAIVIGLLLSPFASGFPDGLEWVAKKYSFLHDSAPLFVSFLPDYTLPVIKNEILTTGIAGLIGVLITFLLVFIIGLLLKIKTGEIKN